MAIFRALYMGQRDIFWLVILLILVTIIAHIYTGGCSPKETPFVGGSPGRKLPKNKTSSDITQYFVDAS